MSWTRDATPRPTSSEFLEVQRCAQEIQTLLFPEEHSSAVPAGGQSRELVLKTLRLCGLLSMFITPSSPISERIRALARAHEERAASGAAG